MEFVVSALYFLSVLSVLVVAHELGHFLVAKWCGMRVEDFSLFFGPPIVRLGKFNGTEYNIRSIPLGGYVKIAGMEPDDLILGAALLRPSLAHGKPAVLRGLSEDSIASLAADQVGDRVRVVTENAVDGASCRLLPQGREELTDLLNSSISDEEKKYIEMLLRADEYSPDPRGYNQRPLWQRAATIAAGPAASLLFGLVLFMVMGFTTGLPIQEQYAIDTIPDAKSPAYTAGLRVGDQIVKFNGAPLVNWLDAVSTIQKHAGQPIDIEVLRSGATLKFTVVPEAKAIDDTAGKTKKVVGQIGIRPRVIYTWQKFPPLEAARQGIILVTRQIVGTIRVIFSKDVGKNTGSLIAIASKIHQDSKTGFRDVLMTAGLLSLSLGIMNLFPIPVLDGGHLLLLSWEGIRRRKLTTREVLTAQLFGFSIIAVLFVMVTFKDFTQEILPHLIKHK